MPLTAVTANFACASPSGFAAARRAAADASASAFVQEGTDLVFAQEMAVLLQAIRRLERMVERARTNDRYDPPDPSPPATDPDRWP